MLNDKHIDGINSFDFDGVVSIGVYPGPNDIIITGRPLDEMDEVNNWLKSHGINNKVYFQQCLKKDQTRQSSGNHKATKLNELIQSGVKIAKHFEDDPEQATIIMANTNVKVVYLHHDLTEK